RTIPKPPIRCPRVRPATSVHSRRVRNQSTLANRVIMRAATIEHLAAFVGRNEELAALQRLTDAGHRLVTVVGPPGIGKSRIVAEFDKRDGDAARGDTVFDGAALDVSEAQSPDDLCRMVAEALELTPVWADAGSTAVVTKRIGDALRERMV